MISTNLIKEGCKIAEGYEYYPDKSGNSLRDSVLYSNGKVDDSGVPAYQKWYSIYSDEWRLNKYEDFLQKVIEGLTKGKSCNRILDKEKTIARALRGE